MEKGAKLDIIANYAEYRKGEFASLDICKINNN